MLFRSLNEHTQCQNTLLNFFLSKQRNISQIFMKLMQNTADKTIGTPQSRLTRIRDHINIPDVDTYMKAYDLRKISLIPSKTKEIAFQILNRTLCALTRASECSFSRNCPISPCASSQIGYAILLQFKIICSVDSVWSQYGHSLS